MISQVVLFLLLITLVGIILLARTTNERRLFIFLPAGMIWGVSIYILLLNFTSKILPGKNGIIFATVCLISLGAIIFISYFKHFKFKFKLVKLTTLLIISSLILTTIYFARLKMTSVFPVADSNMQWAYAASFTRGNYPIKAPWQPDLNPNYHLGAYFLEGAIFSFFKIPLITIHSILNTYYLIAGVLFSMLIFWENKYSFRNIWLVISALVLYISFGVIILIFPGQNFEFFSLTKFPQNIPFKEMAGASLVDLNSLSYLPARSLSLGLALLALYFSSVSFKNTAFKILSFFLLFSTSALVEESMFLPLFLTATAALIFTKQRTTLLKILIATAVVVIIQGGFFLDFLSQAKSSFDINFPFIDSSFTNQMHTLRSFAYIPESKSVNWFVPGPLILTLILLGYAFFTKSRILGLLGLYSLAAILCFLTVEYKYSPSTNLRFLSFASISSGTGIIYLIFVILKSRPFWQNFITSVFVIPIILIPTLLPEILNQHQQINEAKSEGIRSQILIDSNPQTPFEDISDWASQYLPVNSRLIIIDTDQPNPKRSLQFQYKGLYTILGPQYIHTNRPEPGPEFFDLILTLNPTLLKQTKAQYIYIESESLAYQQLPNFRKDDLENSNYFEILKSIATKEASGNEVFFRLLKILPPYLDPELGGKEVEEETLDSLEKLIPQNAKVYIADYGEPPKLSFWYRMAVVLALKDKDIRRNLSQTDYQIIETEIPYKSGTLDEDYDFYILAPGDKPFFPSKIIWSSIYANCWKRI